MEQPPRPHLFFTARPFALAAVVASITLSLLVGGATQALPASSDRDTDGFIGDHSGGDDCTDSYLSAYKSNEASCNPASEATFLESAYDADQDDDIADHAWMQDDAGIYHLFFQNEDNGAGDYIEHYTSIDLRSLTYVGPAVQQTPGAFDRFGLWAPHVVKNPADSLYYMFYAGVTAAGVNPSSEQRVGLATSPDLFTWTKVAVDNCSGAGQGCVYTCDEQWTQWSQGGDFQRQCRDPFVLWDAINSRWLMFTTVLGNVGGPWGQMVSVAQSPDLLNWTGVGYINATKRIWAGDGGVFGQLTGYVAENPFVTTYNGAFHLFFTDSTDPEDPWWVANPRTMVQYASSLTLDADVSGSANWVYRGYTRDPGVNATEIQVVEGDTWFMSHSIVANPYSGYRESHLRDLRLKRILWNDDGTFTTANLTDLQCRVPSGDIHPNAEEICGDGLDNNCSGQADEALVCGVCIDQDADGYGVSGFLACPFQTPDCNDNDSEVYPGAVEMCGDSIDNNCANGVNEYPICPRPVRKKKMYHYVENPGLPENPTPYHSPL